MTLQSGEGEGLGEGKPNYESSRVGYRNPPAERRFKKGQSGNPRGRPRKPKSITMDREGEGTQPANKYLSRTHIARFGYGKVSTPSNYPRSRLCSGRWGFRR